MASERNQRRFDRFRGRLSCSFQAGETTRQAFATNLSAGGLFLQTRTKLEPGTHLIVNLDREGEQPTVLTGTVARVRRAHPSVASVTHPGIGFAVDSAPEAYFRLVMDLLENS